MEAKEAILSRQSTRYFTDEPVSEADIQAIVELAQHTPSWANAQTEHVYVTMGQSLNALRKDFAKENRAHKPATGDMPPTSRHLWPKNAQANMAHWMDGVRRDIGENWNDYIFEAENVLYNSQAVVFLTLPKGYVSWSFYGLGSSAEALLTAATDRGIDSLVAYQFIKYPEVVRANLPIDAEDDIIIGIGLGHRDEQAYVNRITSERGPLKRGLTISD